MKVPAWPNGHVSFDGEVFEFGPGELTRVAVGSLKEIEVKEKAGRLSLKFAYEAGLDKVKTSIWVEQAHQAELEALVAAVREKMG